MWTMWRDDKNFQNWGFLAGVEKCHIQIHTWQNYNSIDHWLTVIQCYAERCWVGFW